jgi:hypothetical protein
MSARPIKFCVRPKMSCFGPAQLVQPKWLDIILRYKNIVWVGTDTFVHSQIIPALHNSAVGGHSGIPVTYKRVKQMFTWKGLKSDVQKFVQHCQVCIQAKSDRSCYPSKLQPLIVSSESWEMVTMDFIVGLLKSASANCILIVVDKFTRYGHFIALSHPYTTHSVALAF